jgi:hypothetical protein
MNERTISSQMTFLMKFIFPILWISGFGCGTMASCLGGFHSGQNPPPPKWLFLAVWLVGSAFIWWACMRLKKVRVGSDAIYVSNFLKEIRVPFDEIFDVTENRWINIHPVTIHFRSTTIFGNKIVFMPTRRLFGWRSHPIVNELRELAHLQVTC